MRYVKQCNYSIGVDPSCACPETAFFILVPYSKVPVTQNKKLRKVARNYMVGGSTKVLIPFIGAGLLLLHLDSASIISFPDGPPTDRDAGLEQSPQNIFLNPLLSN
jgi:hypothetical protein